MTTNTGCTVFNMYNKRFYASNLDAVLWIATKGANIIRTGIETADAVKVIIPRAVKAERAFLPPYEYAAQASPDGFWTLAPKDKIMKGYYASGEISNEDMKRLAETKDNLFTVTSVDFKDFGSESLHYWRVGGR